MKNYYKITFNVPGDFPTEVSVTEEQMGNFYKAVLQKTKIVKIGNSFFNTAYFVKAVPDTEKIIQSNAPKLNEPEMSEEQIKKNKQRLAEMRKKYFGK
ncbi:MAG: hypothetical protein EOM21_21280 [Gammaproteobacteria bacterium]|nr:hypothetical protein [Gammaproteobacteria bacterium]